MLTNISVKEYFDLLSPSERKIVRELRTVIRKEIPSVEETTLWGSLSYHRPWIGGRIKGALCQITVKHGIVKLEFIHGVRLSDPNHLLQGGRVSKRYVVISSVEEASRPEIVQLIREAAELNPKEWEEC